MICAAEHYQLQTHCYIQSTPKYKNKQSVTSKNRVTSILTNLHTLNTTKHSSLTPRGVNVEGHGQVCVEHEIRELVHAPLHLGVRGVGRQNGSPVLLGLNKKKIITNKNCAKQYQKRYTEDKYKKKQYR
jgi:hypothetical protein